jgi:hypothetical protein
VEYTYYGLASLAVLADAASQVTRA